MIWNIFDIVLEILTYLSIKQLHNIKLVNKFLLDITTGYIQNNARKIFKEIKVMKTICTRIEYFSPEIIYTRYDYWSREKLLPYIKKYNDTLLIIFIYGTYGSRDKDFRIDFILCKLQFISIQYINILFNYDSLPKIKYISGNIDISKLYPLEPFTYNDNYNAQNRSNYVSKYISNSNIRTGIFMAGIFTKQIINIVNKYPNLKKLVVNIDISDGFETMNDICFPNITNLTIYNIIRYYPNKQALIFKQIFPNARIKLVDVCLNKTRIF